MKKLIIIVFIFLISVFLYFYKLDKIPSGVYVDEATVAYNAYSISQTGKDEYGFFMPVYFRLMGSYTPSGFIYLASFLTKIFGTEITLFRSISAISMLVSILFFYLLIKNLKIYKLKISYFATCLFFAISPWIVFNARIGYETTLAFLIFNIGVYLLFLALKNTKYLVWAIIFLSLSTYISHNQRFLAPLVLISFLIIFKKALTKKAFFVGLVLNIPNLLLITTPAFWIKNSQFDLGYITNFLMYLSPKTLFFVNPDIDLQHTIPKISIMFDWMAAPYLIGLYLLLKKIKQPGYKFVMMYAIVSLIPAVFSGHFLSTQRSFVFVVPLCIAIGLGIDQILKILKPNLRIVVVGLVCIYSLIILYSSYFVIFPKERANAWNWGYDQVAKFVQQNSDQKFLLDDTRNPRAYSLLLYYLKVPPQNYQDQVDPYYKNNYYSAPDPAKVYKFANVEVRSIDWENDPNKNLFIIGDGLTVSVPQMQEHKLIKLREIKDHFSNTVFIIYRTNLFEP